MSLTVQQAEFIVQALKMAGFLPDPNFIIAEQLIKQHGPSVAIEMATEFDHLVRKLNTILPSDSRIQQGKPLSHHVRSEIRCLYT